MLKARILSAAVAVAILVPALVYGQVEGVTLLVASLSGVALWELVRTLKGLVGGWRQRLTLGLGLALVAAFYVVPFRAVPAVLVGFPLLVILMHLFLYNFFENTIESCSLMVLALAYAIVPLAHAILLAKLDLGIAWVFFVLAVICVGDAGAYFAGKNYGKHHISRRVSPGKTLEGFLGGLLGNLAAMTAMKLIVPGLPGWRGLFLLALILGVLGPLGDLCASAIKRRLEIKDFGAIMPGHGGILDRADSLIPAFPATYYFLVIGGYSIPI